MENHIKIEHYDVEVKLHSGKIINDMIRCDYKSVFKIISIKHKFEKKHLAYIVITPITHED